VQLLHHAEALLTLGARLEFYSINLWKIDGMETPIVGSFSFIHFSCHYYYYDIERHIIKGFFSDKGGNTSARPPDQ
jgi:hypothetical protein